MNDHLFSVKEDLERQLFIIGFRVIFILDKEVITQGNYVSNVSQEIQTAFFNGTVNGNQQVLLQGFTFDDLADKINSSSDKINVAFTINNPEIFINQSDPWNVDMILEFDLNMSDKAGLAEWNSHEIIVSKVPIENFEDPVYFIGTGLKATNRINRTTYEPLVSSNGLDVSNLENHVEGSFYFANPDGPSFLDRLEGKITAENSCCGIESFVNADKLSDSGVSLQEKSLVDHIYFSSQNPSSEYSIAGMQGWFIIDDEHADFYDIDNSLRNGI